eukprot:TRINITY_DN13182_c0_g1_i1.p1 TRINITY_DN13182_c0_g1~~TRINITY_DN13182_c0_g1_i1.p1  ORF type:complete len:137 (+),score=7.64 TRINITY_DN13182_c0_g1_i1:79-489(+)
MFSVVSLLSCSIFLVTTSRSFAQTDSCPPQPDGAQSPVEHHGQYGSEVKLAEPLIEAQQSTNFLQDIAVQLGDNLGDLMVCHFMLDGRQLEVLVAGTNGKSCVAAFRHADETELGVTALLSLNCLPGVSVGTEYDY